MTEALYLKLLTIAIGIITAGAGLISGMLSWYLKGLHTKIQTIEKIQANIGQQHVEITTNYLTRFTNLESKMVSLFEELRNVLNDHFTQRHTEVTEQIAELQAQLVETIRRTNDASADFYKEHAGTLEWAKAQKEMQESRKRKRNVQ
jgi:cellulose biosynthesis protein BcsQ